MKRIAMGLTMAAPSVARACEHGASMGRCGHLSSVLLAGVSALGYWVLHQSSKDSGSVRRAGQVVGWVLIVAGLGGFLCGAAGHARGKLGAMGQCGVPAERSGAMQMPPGQ